MLPTSGGKSMTAVNYEVCSSAPAALICLISWPVKGAREGPWIFLGHTDYVERTAQAA